MKKVLTGFLSAMFALVFAGAIYSYEYTSVRQTYTAYISQRGTTVLIPESVIRYLCGDWDGCTLRLGMHNWDGTRRTASREYLFYYDSYTRNWRASNDRYGTNYNRVTQHVAQVWACYFTDGRYSSWVNFGDYTTYFGLLSWSQYRADCKLTIID